MGKSGPEPIQRKTIEFTPGMAIVPVTIMMFHALFFFTVLYPILSADVDSAKNGKDDYKYYVFATDRAWYFIYVMYIVALLFLGAFF